MRRIARGRLAARMHRGQECDDRVDLRRSEVLAVSRHVAAALNYLANDLVPCETRGSVVERGTAHPAVAAERMAIAALLALHQQRALQFERSAALDVVDGSRRGAPRVHPRRPRVKCAEPGERSYGRNDENHDHY